MPSNSVVIVAGGSGSRMGLKAPKQFALIHNKPIVVYTIEAFMDFDPYIEIILVLPRDHLETWQNIHQEFFGTNKIKTAIGGQSRYQSVDNGLKQVTGLFVAIHDAVRPCVTSEIIRHSFEAAQKFGSGVVAVPLKDSIRETSGSGSKSLDRNKYQIVQTPQTFQSELIKEAFEGEEQSFYTDDASVFEHVLNRHVCLVQGDYRNIKITTPEDLVVVKAFLQD